MNKSVLLSIIAFLFLLPLMGQPVDTVFNQSDAQGRKQGFWRAKYPNGNIKYDGYFKDNKPVGLMKRYNDDKSLEAILFYVGKNNLVKAQLFYVNGKLAAVGNYIGTEKDSVWVYYSFYDNTVRVKESFVKGKRNGVRQVFYSNGNVAEEIEWKNDLKDGVWRQFYEDGMFKLVGAHKNDMRAGKYIYYFPNGKIELEGTYQNNLMQGSWKRFDDKGKLALEIVYKDGNPLNPELLDKEEQEYFRMVETNKGKFAEPTVDDVVPLMKPTPNKQNKEEKPNE
jgi:antitoxin component YwqK of YwqJK toxin-antitoxin module